MDVPPRRASPPRPLPALLRTVALELCALVVPVECPCGQEGTWLCPACRELLHAGAREVQSVCDALQVVSAARVREEGPAAPAGVDYASPFPVLALGEYAGPLQRLVVEWKNRGALRHTAALADALAPVVLGIVGEHDLARHRLVPVPSRARSRIRRGEDHTGLLARALQRRTGVPVLTLRGALSGSQAGKGARQRRRRTFRAPARPARAQGGQDLRVILLDDVVTTGSTLRALHEGSPLAARAVAAVVVASARWPAPPRP